MARRSILRLNGLEIPTPTFIVPTHRGAIPHLTPDVSPLVPLCAIYCEDFFGEPTTGPAIAPSRSSLPLNTRAILTAARNPDGKRPTRVNTDEKMAIDTHHGFQMVPVAEIARISNALSPDLVVVPHDVPTQSPGLKPGANRLRKMKERSIKWLNTYHPAGDVPRLMSCPPELAGQDYISQVNQAKGVIGMSFTEDLPEIYKNYEPIRAVSKTVSPLEMVDLISNGVDLVYGSVNNYTEAGKALMFTLDAADPEPILDLTNKIYCTDMTLIGKTGYTRAYIYHLIQAREMSAQVILQQHNLNVIDTFFNDIRCAIDSGTFETLATQFKDKYTNKL